MNTKLGSLKEFLSTGQLPENPRHETWVTQHLPLLSPQLFSQEGRHLNNFCIGSDPEFSFMLAEDPRRKATAMHDGHLKVGLAAGCDQNERLVELRPWPSPSVVTHVAGILACFRWLYRVNGLRIQTYGWRAGAFFDGDGMGGHIHFGRKRPTMEAEVAGLDGLAHVLRSLGVFPTAEWDRRIKGDALNQHYGDFGDTRKQAHGYEYRTLPSWLATPELAFLCLTASKLVVLDPGVSTGWRSRLRASDPVTLLAGLAKLYKSRDDDAYILYHRLTSNDTWRRTNWTTDFSPAWGIQRNQIVLSEDEASWILPTMIEPDPEEVGEVLGHLLGDIPLSFTSHKPTWRYRVPDGYRWLPTYIEPGRHPGLGDLVASMVAANDCLVTFDSTRAEEFRITGAVAARLSTAERVLLRDWATARNVPTLFDPRNQEISSIRVPQSWCTAKMLGATKALLVDSGIFPLWSVSNVEVNSYTEWQKAHSLKRKAPAEWRTL